MERTGIEPVTSGLQSPLYRSERWSLNTVLNDLIPFVRDQVVPRFHSVVRRP
jgi:hypothetical protein